MERGIAKLLGRWLKKEEKMPAKGSGIALPLIGMQICKGVIWNAGKIFKTCTLLAEGSGSLWLPGQPGLHNEDLPQAITDWSSYSTYN